MPGLEGVPLDDLPPLPVEPEPDNLIVIEVDGVTYKLPFGELDAFLRGLPPYGPEEN